MKKVFLSILVSGIFISPAFGDANMSPELVDAKYVTTYIPHGFDSNDKVQIVGEGIFTDSCYRPANYELEINHETKKIKLQPKAYRYSGMCLHVIVPFSQTINLGLLKVGTYSIYQGDQELGELQVVTAPSANPDDFTYAPVEQAYVDENDEGHFVRVTGHFTNSCMKFMDLRTQVQPRVLVVQPIVHLDKRGDCEEGVYPFDVQERIVQPITPGRYLLHIRSMNGKSVNSLVNIY